ncbi:MAG: hypothetical protein ACRDQ5_26825 [Sciscionella sp.]
MALEDDLIELEENFERTTYSLDKLRALIRILGAEPKYAMCCECLCVRNFQGERYGERLEKFLDACRKGNYPQCGLSMIWSKGIRRFLVLHEIGEDAENRDDVDKVWSTEIQWR